MNLSTPKKLLGMVIFCLLLFSIVTMNTQNMTSPLSSDTSNGNAIHGRALKLNAVYNNTNELRIFGDAQLVNYATFGNGTAGNPYVLEYYNVTSNGTETGEPLYLSGITAYTIVRNNIFDAQNLWESAARVVVDSQNIVFENNTFMNAKKAIYFSTGSNSIIRNQNFVNIQGLSSYSMQFYRTMNILIENLDFSNSAGTGIYLADANSTIIRNTTISGSNGGIEITRSGAPYGQDNLITNTTIDTLSGVGIRDWGYNNTIANCTFRSSQTGIDLFQSTFTTIANNTFTGMTQQAISFSTSSTATTDHIITNNIISNSSTGIYAYSADVENTSILNNTIEGNNYGIDWTTTSAGVNNSVQFNILTNNYNALNFGAYAGANITENLIKNSRSEGIDISSTQNLWVENNTIYNSTSFGLFVAGGGIAIPSVIMYNDFISNGGLGSQVIAYTGDHTVAYNYYSDHSNIDVNLDGIADSPYVFDYGTYSDPTPLITLSSPFSLAVYPPVLVNSNSSIVYINIGSTGNILYWQQVTDDTPATYTISQDGIPISGHNSQSWTSGQNFSISLDGLGLGTHVFTATFSDTYGNTLVSTITVNVVDQSAPSVSYNIDFLANYTYGVFTTFTWNGSDASPAYYSLWLNDVPQITDQIWVSGAQYNFDLLGTIIGLNKITLHLNDSTGNSATLYIYFYMLNGPTISQPADQSYQNGSTGNTISWTVTDDFSGNYTISVDGISFANGTWVSGSPITVNVDNFNVGSHSVVITFTDAGNNTVMDTVVVTVTSNPPTSSAPTSSSSANPTTSSTTSTSTSSSPASNSQSSSSHSSASTKGNNGNGFLPGFNFWFVLISIPVLILLQHRKLKRS